MDAAHVVEYTDIQGVRRRVRYVERETGDWWRLEDEHTGTSWRVVGREPVEEVCIE